MTYKNRLTCLLSIISALVLIYALSFIFNSQRSNDRNSSYVWLDSRLADKVNRIVINAADDVFELKKNRGQWFVLHNAVEYPARHLRVEDFLSVFTKRSAWQTRSVNASSHERFGLTEQIADRVTIYEDNLALLDILIGNFDSTGREVNVRKSSADEVRSGDNSLVSYITSPVSSWYNLRLIPESEDGKTDVDSVQRVSVFNGNDTQIFTRRNRAWTVSGFEVSNLAQDNVENYIRVILNTEGDSFTDDITSDDPAFNNSRIVLEFGNGVVKTIRLTESDENGRLYAHVSGSEYIYSIPAWSAGRLFRANESFERQL